jgi:hypothetical protein
VAALLGALAVLGGLLVVRWTVTDALPEPAAPAEPTSALDAAGPARVPAGTRLVFGGRQALLLEPASGLVVKIPQPPADRVQVWRQGRFTVLVSPGERAWVLTAGQGEPWRELGELSTVLPGLEADRLWLVNVRYGDPEHTYLLDQVRLPSTRHRAHLALPYRTNPLAVVPQGVVASDLDGGLVLVDPATHKARRLAERAHFVDAHGGLVAWLDTDGLHVRDLEAGTERLAPRPAAGADWLALGTPSVCCDKVGAFSPDGRTLVVHVRLAGPTAPGLAVVDPASGEASLLAGSEGAERTDCLPCLAWSSDGWLYFFAPGPARTSVAAWRPGQDRAHLLRADVDEQSGALPTSLSAAS